MSLLHAVTSKVKTLPAWRLVVAKTPRQDRTLERSHSHHIRNYRRRNTHTRAGGCSGHVQTLRNYNLDVYTITRSRSPPRRVPKPPKPGSQTPALVILHFLLLVSPPIGTQVLPRC